MLESGLVNGDVVQVSASGQFADKNVANGKSVALSSSYSGADVGNYSITDQATASANVTPKALTISGITAANKVYDATTLASVSTAGVLESGLVNGDVVHVAATGQFSDPNAATGKTVLLSSSYSGADAGNYSITSQATTSANVTPRTLTIAAGTVVVPADKLASATVDVAVVAGALVGSDQLAALVAPALDQKALAGAVQPLVPPDPVFTQGLASNYNVVKVNGYQIVLPSQAAALNSSSGSGSTPNVFYLQLNQGEIDSATQTLDQLHSTLPRTQTAPLPVEDSLAPGSSPARTWSTDALTRQAAQYLQEIKESTPAVLQNLRSQPLLLWDAQPAGSGVDLSDNGTSH